MQRAEAAFLVGKRALEQGDDLLLGERLEHIDATAREKRGDDFERGIFGGRADQADGALLDVGKEGVLLRFVEAMNLIDEDDGARVPARRRAFRVGHNLLDLLDAGQHGGELDEGRPCVVSAMILASVVLPMPGGPQKIIELGRRARSGRGAACRGRLGAPGRRIRRECADACGRPADACLRVARGIGACIGMGANKLMEQFCN